MGMNFEFAAPTRIIFGWGGLVKVPGIIREKGNRILLVTGRSDHLYERLATQLTGDGIQVQRYRVVAEPTTSVVVRGVEAALAMECDVVAGLGGGSVLDAAKAIAALVPNPGQITRYLEVIGQGRELESEPLPFIAIPTTAGTGSEVTRNAVIHSPEHRVKVSLRSPLMLPDVAVVDPELTVSVPPDVTAATGMDALAHLLETFVSNQSNPFIDMFCREGMRRISGSLVTAFHDGGNREARENLSMAALLGGMALASVKLGAVHGFAAPLGGMFPVPHGVACAALLPSVMEVNIRELRNRGDCRYLAKYDEVARLLTGRADAGAEDGVAWARGMVTGLKVPALSACGISPEDFTEVAAKAASASSMKGNPVQLSMENLVEILAKAWGGLC